MSTQLLQALGIGIALLLTSSRNSAADPATAAKTPTADAAARQFTAERDRLFQQAVQLAAQDKLQSAVRAGRAALEIQRKHLGGATNDACTLLEAIASWQERRADFADACATWKELLRLSEQVRGRDHWSNCGYRMVADTCRYVATLNEADRQRLAEAARQCFQSELLFAAGKYAEAREQAKTSLAARMALLGGEDVATSGSLHMLGSCELMLGNLAAAQRAIEEAAAVRERYCGFKHPVTLTTLTNLGVLYERTGDTERRRAVLEKTALGCLAVYGPAHPASAQSLLALANFLLDQGELSEAEPRFQLALKLQQMRLGEQHLDVAYTLGRLGILCINKKDYPAAEQYLQASLKICTAVAGENDPATAHVLLNLGVLNRLAKNYDQAAQQLQQALDVFRSRLGEANAETIEAITTLALVLPAKGEPAQAERLFKQALELDVQTIGENAADTGKLLFEIGVFYCGWNDFGSGEYYLKRALENYRHRLGDDHADTAAVQSMLATVDLQFGRFELAETRLRQSLLVHEHALGPNHSQTRGVRLALGNLYLMQEQLDAAEQLFQQLLAERSEQSLDRQFEDVVVLEKLAGVALKQADYTRALAYASRVQAIYRDTLPELHPHWSESLFIAAIANLAFHHDDEAKRLADRLLEVSRNQLESTASAQAERQQLAINDLFRPALDLYLSLPTDQIPASEVYQKALLWKGAVEARQIRERRYRQADDLPLMSELQQICSRQATLSLNVPEVAERTAWLEQLDALKIRKESLEAQLAGRSEVFRAKQAAAKLTPEKLQAALPADVALIDILKHICYFGSHDPSTPDETRYVAFVVRHDQPVARIDLGAAQPIDDAVEHWRKDFLFSTERTQDDPAVLLKELVWNALAPHLAGCSTVLISPDASLAKIPLGVLPGKTPGSYLTEDIAIGVVPVPQMLPEMLAEAALPGINSADDPPSLLLVGDIDYDASAASELIAAGRDAVSTQTAGDALVSFGRLKAARGEMEAVQAIYRQRFPSGHCLLLAGATATEAAFRREAAQHDCLLLATHGFFAAPNISAALAVQDQMLGLDAKHATNYSATLCGLALAGANRPATADGDDGILMAGEVSALDLRHLNLAVLSGCETALGVESKGEGVMGLHRAFQVAGARTTVASLWNVPDKKTSELMQRFYANLWNRRLSKLAALREAQIWVMHGGDGNSADRLPPYHWAAFQLSGDWR